MAMIGVTPVKVEVRTDWIAGRPREIVWGAQRLRITRILAVREETAAYPVETGPRTRFEVEADGTAIVLTFRHRSRRWSVDGLDDAVFESRPTPVLALVHAAAA